MDHEAATDPHDLFDTDAAGLAEAELPSVIRLHDGDHLDLAMHPVRKTIAGAELRMLAYNGSIPGPTLHVDQGSEVTVQVTNDGDTETTVHWHGLRLENRYDGVPHETQKPIPIGGSYTYTLQFPDAGFYWYHPHIREDYGQEMGLYGTIVVEPADDVVLAAGRPVRDAHPRRPPRRGRTDRAVPPLGRDPHRDGPVRQRHADQRRTQFSGEAAVGEVVRLYVVNTANTRHLQLRRPRRAHEAGRRRQRSLRAGDVRRRGAARPVGASGRRRAVRDRRRRAPRASHARPGLRPRRVLGGGRLERELPASDHSTTCASTPNSPPSTRRSSATSSARPTRCSRSCRCMPLLYGDPDADGVHVRLSRCTRRSRLRSRRPARSAA